MAVEYVGKGTTVPFIVSIDLEDNRLIDQAVGLTAKFYIKPNSLNQEITQVVTIEKSQMYTPEDQEEGNSLLCLVPTSTLGYGVLMAQIKVTYPAADFGSQTITEINELNTGIVMQRSV